MQNNSKSNEPAYVQQFDAEPQFWQFLGEQTDDDLVVELIQNELDAGATHTTISFFDDHLTCLGNGEEIDKDGWKRLTFVVGAGQQAPRKRNRIGVKNHGLKACFQIGDDIVIRSSGRMMKQTLYKDGPRHPPTPATFEEPQIDKGAPNNGCRVCSKISARSPVDSAVTRFISSAWWPGTLNVWIESIVLFFK